MIRVRNSHCNDKTVSRPSYFYNEKIISGMTVLKQGPAALSPQLYLYVYMVYLPLACLLVIATWVTRMGYASSTFHQGL